MYLVCKLYLKYLMEKKEKKKKSITQSQGIFCYAPYLIKTSKSHPLPPSTPAHETKMHQCLPCYLWYTCIVGACKYDENQDFKKIEDKHTAQ